MKKQSLILSCLIAFVILSFFHGQQAFSQAVQPPPDLVVKITRVDKILKTVDRLSPAMPNEEQASPSTFLRSMMMGTNWIDSQRAIVAGVFLKKDSTQPPDAAALIPFSSPNDDFLMNYNAVAGKDYYVIPLPPGKGGIVSDRMEEALVAASLNPPDALVSIDLAASQMIAKADQQIQKMMQTLDQKMPTDASDTEVSAKQVQEMLANLIETGKQLETLSLGMNLLEPEISFFCNAKAHAESGLANVFDVDTSKTPLILADYKPEYPITFRSKPYGVDSIMDFFDKHFGPVYDQMGVDFSKLKEISQYFSGEMAGGAGFDKDGLNLEVIAVFDETRQLPEDYLNSVYLPWILDYGKKMAEIIRQQAPDRQQKNLFEKMAPSTVAGQSVIGLKGKMPMDMQSEKKAVEFQLRMTRLDSMLLTASDDKRLEKLIENAGNFKKAALNGPLMQMDIDLSAYLAAIIELMPDQSQIRREKIPELGKLNYTLDMTDGMLKTRYSMKLEDIQKMAGYFKTLAQEGKEARQAIKTEPSESQSERKNAQKAETKPDKDSPQYWLNRGDLFATYGNDSRAIEHYKKAIELDPNNSKAFFNLGVSYGEIGKHGQALDAINRAIALQPAEGDYYYARGWIYLHAGNKDKAMANMAQAADMGNPDAKKYLESIGGR